MMQLAERWRPYVYALAACLGALLLSAALLPLLDLANISMLFLLVVMLVAVRHGIRPAIFAAVLAGLLFDYFFVYPPLGFAFKDTLYLVTFSAMLVVGVITGGFTAGLRSQADTARRQEHRARLLSAFARDMSAAVDTGQVVAHAQRTLSELFAARVVVMLPDAAGTLTAHDRATDGLDARLALQAWQDDIVCGQGTTIGGATGFRYLPLRAPGGRCGVLALRPRDPATLDAAGAASELEAFSRLVAIAVERIRLVDETQDMRLRAAAEGLRNSMLAALSHDLRTPLASLVGLADALVMSTPLPDSSLAIANDIRGSALHMSRLVDNLLDMARIQSGGMRLRREWNSLEEIIGAALRSLGSLLAGRRVQVQLPAAFPLVECDALLLERVVANLVENAAKYSGDDDEILVRAAVTGDTVSLHVIDHGRGLPANVDPFARFVRGEADAGAPGVGLGLAICRAFIEAHGGRIVAANLADGGTEITVQLPAGTPPDAGSPDA